jgi:hypothetical protein
MKGENATRLRHFGAAESRDDFIHKVGVANKEVREAL